MYNKKILIADDDMNILDIYDILFKKKYSEETGNDEYAIKTFDDGAYLLEYFNKEYEKGNKIPLCILDMRMPHLDGFETARQIRKRDPDVIIVIVTAFGDMPTRDIKEQLKKDIYHVSKPFNDEDLLCLVDSLLKGWNRNMELKESEERYGTLFNSMEDLLFLVDHKGRIIQVNPAVIKALGYSEKELLKLTVLDLYPPELREETSQIIIDIFAGRKDLCPLPLLAKNGERISVETKINRLILNNQKVILGISRDITGRLKAEKELEKYRNYLEELVEKRTLELKNANEELHREIEERKKIEAGMRESEEQFRTVFHTSPDAISISRLKDGEYLDVNEGFTSMIGYTREEVIYNSSKKVNLWYKPEDKDIERNILEEKGYIDNVEVEFYCKDGSIRTGLKSAKIIHLKGEPHILSITRDITEMKKAQEDYIKLERQLRQSQKMESLGTLAGGIAHEFNNILGIILGCTAVAVEEVSKGSIADINLKKILKASNRAKGLIGQILAFSRQKEQEKRPVHVSLIIKEVLTLLEGSLPASIDVKTCIEEDSNFIMGDPTEIHQIVMNLCTNAFHAMREKGGTLEIKLRPVEFKLKDLIFFQSLTPGPYLELTVSDTGTGMRPEVMEKIFEPYFTTKEQGDGTGMGLSVVHGIMKNHKGEVMVESEPDKGTTFRVYFPRIENYIMPEVKDKPPPPEGREHILLIDDEEDLIFTVQLRLERSGYKVTSAVNSREALELFKKEPEKFDIVITDQSMPGITGTDLAKKILEIRPDMPIILCTGFSEIIDSENAKSKVIKEIIMKPFDIEDLTKAIRNIMKKKTG